jgi:hypothetical protein
MDFRAIPEESASGTIGLSLVISMRCAVMRIMPDDGACALKNSQTDYSETDARGFR